MAVEMIGGPRLCKPLLATGLGRFTGAPPPTNARGAARKILRVNLGDQLGVRAAIFGLTTIKVIDASLRGRVVGVRLRQGARGCGAMRLHRRAIGVI